MRYFSLASRFLFFLSLPVFAEVDLQYLVKSHQWNAIATHFKSGSPTRESEVYSLVEYHEKAPDANPDSRLRYLVSLVRGVFVESASTDEIKKILNQTMPFQTTLFRLSFWKLYVEIQKKNFLNEEEKIQFLNRLHIEEDPIYRRCLDELLRLYEEKKDWKAIREKVQAIPESSRKYLLTGDSLYRFGKAKILSGEEKSGMEDWINCLQKEGIQESTIQSITRDWKKIFSRDPFFVWEASEVTLLLPILNKKEKEKLFLTRPELFTNRIPFDTGFRHLTLTLAKSGKAKELFRVLENNRSVAERNASLIVALGDILFQEGLYSDTLFLLQKFPGKDAGYKRIYASLYQKFGKTDLYFENLVYYLSEYPFNLNFQDKLLEFLVVRRGEKIEYAPFPYFEKALSEIPNLPVKGRLVYWYLRALRDANQVDRLRRELRRYYQYCPGSYYTRVIREEFLAEILNLGKPDNPTLNRDTLFEFLSYTAGIPEESTSLWNRNLGFAFPKNAYELGNRLSNNSSRITGNRILNLAKDYFRIGEDQLGLSLVNYHIQKEGLSEEEKEVILVGMGEVSNNTYYSAFYTRALLKRYLIPDDPILLPTQISTRIFPRPHRDLVSQYAKENEISEDAVYALMRQESFFKETATSRSNARGLMQIMPATGKELASRLGLFSYSLYEPQTSIRFGTKFLAYLLRSNGGDLKWASIAYNGGPGNLRKWKRNHFRGDFNHFLEDLPVKESRDYCRIVVSNFYAYDIMKKYHRL